MVTCTVSEERCSKQDFSSGRKTGWQRRCQISLCLLREKRAVKQGNDVKDVLWKCEAHGKKWINNSQSDVGGPAQRAARLWCFAAGERSFVGLPEGERKVPLCHSPNLGVSLSCSVHLQARWVCAGVSGSLQKQQRPLPRLISCALQQGLAKIWKHLKAGRIEEKQIARLHGRVYCQGFDLIGICVSRLGRPPVSRLF